MHRKHRRIANSPVQLAGGQVIGNGAPAPTSLATTVTLSPDAGPNNPSVYGQSVTFTATVSPANSGYGPPSGTVDFYDEATGDDSGEIGLVGGVAYWTYESRRRGPLHRGDVHQQQQHVRRRDGGRIRPDGQSGGHHHGGEHRRAAPNYGDSLTITADVST